MSTPMLNGADVASSFSKSLPLVSKDDDLPKPPLSSPSRDELPLPPPPLPPKINCDIPEGEEIPSTHSASAARSAPPSPFRETLSIPEISSPPESPSFASTSHSSSPQSLSAVDARPKKANPFVDLMETEKSYVDTLSGIIRKVASAWSRSNLPPSQLDSMFRSIEAIFKANRFLLAKLKEIGLNPSSPRAIGDLLMKWIDHLDVPYTNYCQQYLSGFDTWESVQSNPRLASVLESFSTSNPPPPGSVGWTLDALFALPRARIKYYQKLYNRLLKNSGKGKATDKMLVSAVENLDRLMAMLDERNGMSLPISSSRQPAVEMMDEVVIDTRNAAGSVPGRSIADMDDPDARLSVGSSARESSSSGQRSSRETAPTSEGGSPTMPAMTVLDLERRLSTRRCLDLFTMKGRDVRLSISSANLPYTRELRLSEDASVYFTPKSTAQEVVHQQGHIFLLTDLFLVCEWITPNERAGLESEQVDMWLCYPPLAAKHLRVAAVDVDALEITVLKKEVLTVRLGSSSKRDFMLREFQAVIDAAFSLPPPSKQPPPPVPPIPGLPRTPSALLPSEGSPLSVNTRPAPEYQSRSGSGSPRAMSPAANPSLPRRTFSVENDNSVSVSSSLTTSLVDHGPEPPPYSPERLQSPGFPGMDDPTGSRNGPPPFGPGQVMPPQRSDSSRSLPSVYDPRPGMGPVSGQIVGGQIIPPPRGQSAMSPPPQLGLSGMGPPGSQFPPRSNSIPQQSPFGRGPPGPMGPGGQFMGGPPPPPGRPLNGPPMQIQQAPYPPMGPPLTHQQQYDPSQDGTIHKSPSTRSLGSQHDRLSPNPQGAPPMPHMNPGYPQDQQSFQQAGHLRPMLQSNPYRPGIVSIAPTFVDNEPSPPDSPVEDQAPVGPAESAVTATVKCKVFLKQQHAQWKSLGSAKLTLYEQAARRDKQIVVQSENKDKTMLISTMVLTDGVERVGKTGVAIEISDKGARTGIVYMLQLRNEKAAGNMFDLLIAGSDRSGFAP